MEELINSMKRVLSNSFAFYLKTHNYHWNVEGRNFNDDHAFFGTLYQEVWGAVDLIAEQIRVLDSYAPGSFSRFKELSTVQDELTVPDAETMYSNLMMDNNKVISSLEEAFMLADRFKQNGLSNFLQDRIDIHKKHGWMLKSICK